MTIIDRYLLRQFFKTFLICYVSLTGLYVVFDAFTNVEQFISCAKQTNSGTLTLIGSFYSYQSILIFDRTAALLTLVAAMFTIAWLQRHNEMTALMSAGITRVRIIVPILAAAIGIILFVAVNRELVIPQFREQLAQRPQDLAGGEGRVMSPRYVGQTGVFISGRRTYADRQRIEAPRLRMPATLQQYGKWIVAKNAFYQAAEDGRPSGYLLDEVERPKDLTEKPSLRLDGEPVLITPADAPDWLKPNQCFLRTGVDFDQLTGGLAFREFSSTSQLMAGLRNDDSLGFRADVRVAIHSRLVQPFLDITLLMLGLPLVVTRQDRNVFVAIGLCLLVVTVFVLVVIGAQQLGSKAVLSAALAAWLPLMIFVPPAVWLGGSMSR